VRNREQGGSVGQKGGGHWSGETVKSEVGNGYDSSNKVSILVKEIDELFANH